MTIEDLTKNLTPFQKEIYLRELKAQSQLRAQLGDQANHLAPINILNELTNGKIQSEYFKSDVDIKNLKLDESGKTFDLRVKDVENVIFDYGTHKKQFTKIGDRIIETERETKVTPTGDGLGLLRKMDPRPKLKKSYSELKTAIKEFSNRSDLIYSKGDGA